VGALHHGLEAEEDFLLLCSMFLKIVSWKEGKIKKIHPCGIVRFKGRWPAIEHEDTTVLR
jgi:hypothetical protein